MKEHYCPRCRPEQFKTAGVKLEEMPEGQCSSCDFRVCSTYYCWTQLDFFIFVKFNSHFQEQTEIYRDANYNSTEKILVEQGVLLDPSVSDDELRVWLAFS